MPPPNSFPGVGSSFEEVRESSDMFGTGVCVPLHPRRMFGACNLWGAPSLAPPPGGGSPESVGRKTARSHPKLKSILECQRGSLIQFAFSGQPLSFCWPLGPRGGGRRGKTQPRTQLPIKGPAYGFSKILDSRL